VPDGPCPAGTLERYHRKVTDDGFDFVKPKSRIVEEE